jgi:hypothetical protein
MGLLLFMCTLLVSMAGLADFLIEDAGDRLLRDKLFKFYLAVEGDWAQLYKVPAAVVARFLYDTLGSTWGRYVWRVALYSLVISTAIAAGILIGTKSTELPMWEGYSRHMNILVATFFTLCIPNIAGDLIAWGATRRLLKSTAKDAAANAVGNLIGAVIIGGITAWLTFEVMTAASYLYEHVLGTCERQVGPFYVSDRACSIEGAWDDPLGLELMAFVGPLPLLVLLPIALYVGTTIVGLILVATKPFSKTPLVWLLAKVERSPRHLLAIIAAVVSGIATLVTALTKLV